VIDFKDCFESIVVKWKKVFVAMMGFSHNMQMRNEHAYKKKWMIVYGDYKRFETTYIRNW
jgi:hypothetical protein